jgi:hypothetical protein
MAIQLLLCVDLLFTIPMVLAAGRPTHLISSSSHPISSHARSHPISSHPILQVLAAGREICEGYAMTSRLGTFHEGLTRTLTRTLLVLLIFGVAAGTHAGARTHVHACMLCYVMARTCDTRL